MKHSIKPYRFIKNSELHNFRQSFGQIIQDWNEHYALSKFEFELNASAKATILLADFLLIKTKQQTLAMVNSDYLSALRGILFADHSACFNPVCETLLLKLLTQLLNTEQPLEISPSLISGKDWFYPGSLCLYLTLKAGAEKIDIYLHPDWVFEHLAKPEKSRKAPTKLESALAENAVQLSVYLTPIRLSLEDLGQLKVGDLIQTEHALTAPLLLQYQQKKLGQAKLGQAQDFKSIQLVETP